MHCSDNLRVVFVEHLGKFFQPPEFLDGPEGLITHMYLGHLLHQTAAAPEADLLRGVASLIEDLHFGGDEDRRELVHVSFFENMDRLTSEQVSAIYDALTPRMREVMLDAFRSLGYVL